MVTNAKRGFWRRFGSKPVSAIDAENAINALYLGLLGRAADPDGLRNYLNALAARRSLENIALEIAESEEAQRRHIPDHSQFGEFRLLLERALVMSSAAPIVVDVGARGVERSNSFDLLKTFCWKGLLIEANPALWEDIEQGFAGLNFELARCAISTSTGRVRLHRGVNDDISSLSKSATSSWGTVRDSVEVEARRLGDVLKHYRIPEKFGLLSIDIEGLDVEVLLDLLTSTNYAPQWIIIEVVHDTSTSLEAVGLAPIADRYRIISQTPSNIILEAMCSRYS